MKKRSMAACVALMLLIGACGVRLYVLQGEEELAKAATGQSSLTLTLGTSRGTIYDCQKRPLVNRDFTYVSAIAPTAQAMARVRECFDKETAAGIIERLEQGKPVTVKTELPLPLCEGITQKTVPVRYGDTIAAHVVGYTDEAGGVCGAEYAFDEQLSAYSGAVEVTYTVDGLGIPLSDVAPTVKDTTDKSRGGVVLTIDSDVQQIAERAATQMTCGAVVVMEPKTGAVRAMVSVPDYDPAAVEEVLNEENAPLLNRALADYNCGSVFKIVTASAALEAGFSPSTSFDCTGGFCLGDTLFRCHYWLGHGTQDMKEAFAKSCNPYYIQLARAAGAEAVYDMAVSFGFDRAWTLAPGLSTARATLPSLKTLKTSQASLCNLAFGQGELLATPVHVAQLAAAVVNGGAIARPTLLEGTVDENGNFEAEQPSPLQEVFSEKTAKTLWDMMIYTMEEGTGAKGQPYYAPAAAKTGTAETGWTEDGKEVVQHWFTGFFPANEPQYVITVLCENSEATGESAAPVFREICEELYFRALQKGG